MQYRTVANLPDPVHKQGFPDIDSYKIYSSEVSQREITKVTASRYERIAAPNAFTTLLRSKGTTQSIGNVAFRMPKGEKKQKVWQEGPWVHPAYECTSCTCCFPKEKVTAKVVIYSVAEAVTFRYLKPPSVIDMCCPSCA